MSNPRKKKPVNATAPRRGHQLPARVDDDLWTYLKAKAKAERRSVSQTIIIIIEEARRAEQQRKPPTDPHRQADT